jgi:chromosome transmission fidelity protein 4
LLHWRTPSQARWVPLLDTKLLSRLASGRKTETYWPVAVSDNKFHCIILKGGDQYPYFPRPLLSDFDFKIPLTSSRPPVDENDPDNADVVDEKEKLEESYVQKTLHAALMSDLVEATSATHTQRSELARKETEVDKALLQLLMVECREGEERGMKALELVELMRDASGRMMEAASKVADRYGRGVLGEKIREVGERRLLGGDMDEL